MILPTLYKRGVKGEVREWTVVVDGARHRVITGVKDGVMVYSDWTLCFAKNVGKKNETMPEEQADIEAKALWKKKTERGYFEDINDIDKSTIFKPMLAQKYSGVEAIKKRFPGREKWTQPKLDGIRCIARADGLWTRTGKPITGVPHICRLLEPFFHSHPNVILDGELYNHDLWNDFNTITSIVRKAKPSEADLVKSQEIVQYHIYDCLIKGYENEPFRTRQANLEVLIRCHLPHTETLQRVRSYKWAHDTTLDAYYEMWLEQGYEGQMIRIDGPYENKRSHLLQKRKEFVDEEYEVIGIEEGKGNWSGYAKRVVLKLPDGRPFGAGIKGNQDRARKLIEDRETYIGGTATVRYFALTPDGVPRFPVVVDFQPKGRKD